MRKCLLFPVIVTAAVLACPAAADRDARTPVLFENVTPLDRFDAARPWWMQTYGHSMQERTFLVWMDKVHGGPGWRFTMSPALVLGWWQRWLFLTGQA